MKKLLLTILTAILSLACTQVYAQLTNGDYVTIRYDKDPWDNTFNPSKFMEVSSSGVIARSGVSDECLLQLEIVNGNYIFKDVSSGRYLKVNNTYGQPNEGVIELATTESTSASGFKFTDKGSVQGQYMYGNLSYTVVIPQWGNAIQDLSITQDYRVAGWNPFNLYIEKWEKVGGGDATSHFNPDKVVFEYADGTTTQEATTVNFVLETSSQSYYKCVCRDEMHIGGSSETLDPNKVGNIQISWLSSNNSNSIINLGNYTAHAEEDNRTLMSLSGITKSGDNWQFSITPVGKSPMGLKQLIYEEKVDGTTVGIEQYVDYVDWVVLSYTYDGNPFTLQLRVVRKSYHEEQLPPLIFSINPMTYTFSKEAETKNFDIDITHQHGTVLYNINQQPIDIVYTEKPDTISLSSDEWELTFNTPNWLSISNIDNNTISVTAAQNGDQNVNVPKRSHILIGTLTKKDSSADPHTGTFEIDLHQRGMNAGGIQFIANTGKGDNQLQKNAYTRNDEQRTHTAERTIYYRPGDEIELRLPEAGFAGYMRWYDYMTGGDPYYNLEETARTTWNRAPQTSDNKPFAAINTPKDGTDATIEKEGISHGLYAINKADGGLLDEENKVDETTAPLAPRIKGWSDGAYHIMACDASAYIDYNIWMNPDNATRIDSIQEPTLSYRQLFHLKPAEEIADKFDALEEGKFLEEYSYQAPAGKTALLATEYRFCKVRSHESEMCYFYHAGEELRRITDKTPVVWKEYTLQNDGTYGAERTFTPEYTSSLDYLKVREDRYPVQKKYTLTLPANAAGNKKELRIASFEVKFLDIEVYGPTEKTIITQQRIETDYDVLATINFDNYDSHDKHLPWDYTSYGYVYDVAPLNTDKGYKRGASQGIFPFYGEYTVVESVNKDWANSSAHNGRALYVDGTMEPGLVATIAAPTNICSGQTVYCSAWFRNPRPNNDWAANANTANPIFRCNIQGKNETGEWEDAGVYFVGELAIGSQWQQVAFPIESAHSYDSTRVSIYNFATTNQGNDFMVDDINLYVSRLPIAAYQGKMACRSDGGELTRAAAILRLDYTNINVGDARYMYYQIFNSTMKQPVELEDEVAYYHEAPGIHNHSDFGSVGIPDVTFDPEVHNAKPENKNNQLKIYYSVSKLLDDMIANNWQHAKAYVKTENSGVVKWLLYVAHLIDQVTATDLTNENQNTLPLQKLFDEHTYVMRMAYTPEELPTAECNLTTPIHATQQTVFTLRNSDKKTIMHNQASDGTLTAVIGADDKIEYILKQSYGNCANDLYFLTSTVVNHLAVEGLGNATQNIAAPIYSDWLIGDPDGDVLSEIPPQTGTAAYEDYYNRLQASIAGFEKKYGYTHGQVSHAIMYDMRRVPTEDEPNPNYAAKTFKELDPSAFESLQNYEIVRSLYENGWLQLYDTTVHFYLGSQDTARYWCFPIAETAKAIINGQEVTIKDCNEPHRVMVTSVPSDYQLNVAPILKKDKTAQQKLQLPNVKVLANNENKITSVTIPIKEITTQAAVDAAFVKNQDIVIDLISGNFDPTTSEICFFDLDLGEPIAKPNMFEIGKEYTIRLAYEKSNGGALWLDGEGTSCRVGYIFFILQVVPNTLIWQPIGTSFNGWGKNENWRGWKDNGNSIIDEGELTEGFVPITGSNVVIPKLNNSALYPYIVPEEDHNHYEMTVHFDAHHCKNIYFQAGAQINNQHILRYEKAFVDMQVPAAKWNMMASPLAELYSGDIFIPHTSAGMIDNPEPFEVAGWEGQRWQNAPYAFWQAHFNRTVTTHWSDGSTTDTLSSNNAEFAATNGLDVLLEPGTGFQIKGLGPNSNSSDELIVRLPKNDNQYYYYSSRGEQTERYATIPRTSNAGKLAYDNRDNNGVKTITLRGEEASTYFVFGNPTMAYIDLVPFMETNPAIKAVYQMSSSTWLANTDLSMYQTADRYLAPTRSILVEVENSSTTLTLTLKPEHLTLTDLSPKAEAEQRNERRRTPSTGDHDTHLMTIYAFNAKGTARGIIAYNDYANDDYLQGEDALFLSTGIDTKADSYTPMSPINLYSLHNRVPMMVDMRENIDTIPLGMLVSPNHRTAQMQMAFYLSQKWDKTCYLYDAQTDSKTRIMDGLILTLDMPFNHKARYYIVGPDRTSNQEEVVTSTERNDITQAGEAQVWAYSSNDGQIIVRSNQLIEQVTVYDLTGRIVAHHDLSLLAPSTTISVPAKGVYIIQAKLLHHTTPVHCKTL